METQAIIGLAIAAATRYLRGDREAFQFVDTRLVDEGTPDEHIHVWFAGVLPSGFAVVFRRTQGPGTFPTWHIGDPHGTNTPVEAADVVQMLEYCTDTILDL